MDSYQQDTFNYWVANPVGICVSFLRFFVSGKVFPVTHPLSGVFVYRVFCLYVDGFHGVGECVDFSGGHRFFRKGFDPEINFVAYGNLTQLGFVVFTCAMK